MPLLQQHVFSQDTKLQIWEISEDADFFEKVLPLYIVAKYANHSKKTQHLAARLMLQRLIPTIDFNEIGVKNNKPFLQNNEHNFNLSHSKNIAATMVSNKQIGLDVQCFDEKIKRVISKFLNAEEQRFFNLQCTTTLCILWAIKEAVYKLEAKSSDNYANNIIVLKQSILTNTNNVFNTIIAQSNQKGILVNYDISYFTNSQFVLAYCLL